MLRMKWNTYYLCFSAFSLIVLALVAAPVRSGIRLADDEGATAALALVAAVPRLQSGAATKAICNTKFRNAKKVIVWFPYGYD